MDLQQAQINNFLTIGSAVLELDNRGLILIQGQNDDDTSAKSNGAGKSSIVDAICWCLYGETARGVTGDLVVNRTAKKDCQVACVWVDGNYEYRIVRYRKHAVAKNMLTVHQRDLTTGVGTDLSKGTDKETQEVVRKIMGCSLDVFKGSIYAGQEAMPDLPGMTDKQLKLLIEEAAGTGELADAYAEARKRALTVESKRDAGVTGLASLKTRLAALRTEHAAAQTEHAAFETGRKDRARTELAAVAPHQRQIETAEAELALIPEEDLNKKAAELDTLLAGRRQEEAELAKLTAAERVEHDKLVRFKSTLENLQASVNKAEQNLADVDSRVGTPCGECGKAYCEHDLETVRQMRVDGVALAKKTYNETVALARVAQTAHKEASQRVADFQKTMTDVTAVAAERAVINDQLRQAAALNAIVTKEQVEVAKIKDRAKLRITETNPWTVAVAGKAADVERCEKEIAVAEVEVLQLEQEAELYNDAVKVFGPAGVRAHILDTVTPFLNEKTGEYLGALADGNITALWSTLAKTAKGDLKEKFNIDVNHTKGGETFAGLSGGEKRKVRLSSALALQDMQGSRAEKPINLFIADEIDHALDEPGLERLMGVLEKKARDRGTVLVISHNSLTDWIDNVITVTKKAGYSEVTGATHRGF